MSRQDELDRAVGAVIRELRNARGLSQEALAAEADLDQSLLSKVERLGPGAIGWQRFCRIASVLGCEVELRLNQFGGAAPETEARAKSSPL
jgi:transcriptional regulator with XRE-family HTH domain